MKTSWIVQKVSIETKTTIKFQDDIHINKGQFLQTHMEPQLYCINVFRIRNSRVTKDCPSTSKILSPNTIQNPSSIAAHGNVQHILNYKPTNRKAWRALHNKQALLIPLNALRRLSMQLCQPCLDLELLKLIKSIKKVMFLRDS